MTTDYYDIQEGAWFKVVNSVKTPLSFFALTMLLVGSLLVSDQSPLFSMGGQYCSLLKVGGVALMFVTVIAVAILTCFYPKSLIEGHASQADGTAIVLENRTRFPTTVGQLLSSREPGRVDISGLSLLATLTAEAGVIGKLANSGCKFRILMLDPNSPATFSGMGTRESIHGTDPDVRHDILDALRRADTLIKTGHIEVRLSQYAPSFSLLILDPEAEDGLAIVELYLFAVPPSDRLHFTLSSENEDEFAVFKEQFEALWREAKVYNGVLE